MPFDTTELVLDNLTVQDCMSWRRVCHRAYALVSQYMRSDLRRKLRPFVNNPARLLDILSTHRAVFGGMFALAFFLRDPSFRFETLDIYVPKDLYSDLVDTVEGILDRPAETVTAFGITRSWSSRETLACIRFRLDSCRSIVVHRSSSWTALSPICRSPCTALFNYVSAYAFGCAYPHLTMRWRALLADLSLDDPLPFDFWTMNSLTDQGFQICWSPARLSQRVRTARGLGGSGPGMSAGAVDERTAGDMRFEKYGDYPASLANRLRPSWGAAAGWQRHWSTRRQRSCYAHEDICPRQFRYFGDRSCYMDFFDPLSGDPARLVDQFAIPYGTIVGWKLESGYLCTAPTWRCRAIDPDSTLLQDGVVCLPALPGPSRLQYIEHWKYPPLYLYLIA